MITPICVAAAVSVGDSTDHFGAPGRAPLPTRSPSTFTVPSSRTLMLAGFEITVDDTGFMSGL